MDVANQPGLLFWHNSSPEIRLAARQTLQQLVTEHVDELVATFYRLFLSHEEASDFLNHSVVNERLNQSMSQWLLETVRMDPGSDLTDFDARQIKIGEVHARLKIPNNLVMEGMSLLKSEIATKVATLDLPVSQTTHTIIILGEIIDYAMRLMTSAYVNDTNRRAQTDEAFRFFSLGQDISLEREIQRAALMEWSQNVLLSLLGHGSETPATLASSPFGLWARHRAAILFQGSPTLDSIERVIAEIDGEVLSTVIADKPNGVVTLQRRIDEIRFLLNDLFQAASALENGRDPLTRTFNRRFLSSVLRREVSLATRAKTPLSVLMADIDHFKHINDRHGHSAGDAVLSHTADILLHCVRATDFVFRYGGEEFLIVLVESDHDRALTIAERIRQQIAAKPAAISNAGQIPFTMSIGVATFEGHPDYQYLIDAADKALYRAKESGRNRVVSDG